MQTPRPRKATALPFASAALLSCLLGAAATAEQLAFETARRGATIEYAYRFDTPAGARQRLRFELPRSAVEGAVAAFDRLDLDDLRRSVAAQHAATLRRLAPGIRARFPDVEIIVDDGGTLTYRTESDDLKRRGAALQRAIEAFNAEAEGFNDWAVAEPRRLMQELAEELNARFPQVSFTVNAEGGLAVTGSGSRSDERRIETAVNETMRRFEREFERRVAAYRASLDAQQEAIGREQANLARGVIDLRRQFDDSRAEIEAAIADARAAALEEQAAYLRQRAYTTLDERSVIPDYRSIARESVRTLQPVAEAFLDGFADQDMRIDALLGFMQSIPYDTLQSRLTSNGAGFALPLALIGRNRGDCDTKAVAFAAVLQGIAPEIPVVLLLLEDHALLGLGVDAQPGTRTFEHRGRRYVLAEPVGPALIPVGGVGPETITALDAVQAVVPLF